MVWSPRKQNWTSANLKGSSKEGGMGEARLSPPSSLIAIAPGQMKGRGAGWVGQSLQEGSAARQGRVPHPDATATPLGNSPLATEQL